MPFEPEIVTITSNYTAVYGNKVILVDTATATGNVTISLLEIGNGANQAGLGYTITVKDIGGQAATKNIIINAYSGDNIDSVTSLTISDNAHSLMMQSNGSSSTPIWMMMSFYSNWNSMMPVTKAGENYLSLSGQQITANSIDLSNTNVTGTLPSGKLPTGIPATNIGGGLVDNTEFSYLNGVTSAIQAQLDSKIGSFSNQTANTVFSGPTTGGAAAPTFRTLVVGDLPTSGIPATSIGTGTVNNTEFGYLDGVTSSIQTQLDSKASGSRSFSNPARTLNSSFQISTTRDCSVSYSVNITVAALLITGQSGTVFLEYADNSGMTTNLVTAAQTTNSTGGVLSITNTNTANLNTIIPAGKYVRLRTANNTGTPTFNFLTASEILL